MRLYLRLIGARVRGQLQYRASFLLRVLGNFTTTFVELIAIIFLLNTFHELGGWRVGEVALLYSIASMSLALAEIFGQGFDEVTNLVRTGEFDRVLTRPVAPFVQVLAADIDPRNVGRLAQGGLSLLLALRWTSLEWTVAKALLLVVAVLSTALVFGTVLVIGAAICFWTIERSEVQNIFTYGGTELASNPLQIYSRWMQRTFIFIVPIGLTSYYPALYILDRADPFGWPRALSFVAPLVALAFFGLGLLIWAWGLRKYQSVGA